MGTITTRSLGTYSPIRNGPLPTMVLTSVSTPQKELTAAAPSASISGSKMWRGIGPIEAISKIPAYTEGSTMR